MIANRLRRALLALIFLLVPASQADAFEWLDRMLGIGNTSYYAPTAVAPARRGSCPGLLSATDVLLATDGQLHAADMLSHGLSAGAGYDLLPYVDVRSVHRLSAHCDEAGHVVRHAG